MRGNPNFDPRLVPVHSMGSGQPAIPPQALHPQALAARFATPAVWQTEHRSEVRNGSVTTSAQVAASVLVPLVQREELTVLLTQRTTGLSTHSGQIAFPGGKAEPTDGNAAVTALREAQEEIGLLPQFVHVLGELPLYPTITSFQVTPVVALVREGFVLRPNPDEVAEVFEIPLAFLMNPAHHRLHQTDWQGEIHSWYSMPYQHADQERFVWGATAGILRNLYRFLAVG